jgi:AcrR family transcriptional regulator
VITYYGGMNAGRTARERARAELTQEIKDEARRQLGVVGANGLSLRAVARELGMVSSALYRYFPSRDELLTALIIDAYDSVGAAAEDAAARVPPGDYPGRWAAACRAVRAWALAGRNEYALIYGSPVPGYRAPETTIGPAARVPLVLTGIVSDAWAAGAIDEPPPDRRLAAGMLGSQVRALAVTVGAPDLPRGVLARAVLAWTQLFGMISFELFGQFARTIDPADEAFEYAIGQMTGYLGMRVG